MALSRREIVKDVVQQSTEAAIASTGHVVAIMFETARKVTTEVGAFGTEIFEIAESARRASSDLDDTNPSQP